MNIIEEIRKWQGKPKELVLLQAEVKKDSSLFVQLIEGLRSGSDVEKGVCAEVMEYATKDSPELALPYVESITQYID